MNRISGKPYVLRNGVEVWTQGGILEIRFPGSENSMLLTDDMLDLKVLSAIVAGSIERAERDRR